MARPTIYTQELFARICDRMAAGESLIRISDDPDMPAANTVYNWLSNQPALQESYIAARELQADRYAQMMLDAAFDTQGDVICDEYGNEKPNHEFIQRSKLKVDVLKWHASRLAPKKYGDKIEQTVVGDPNRPVHVKSEVDVKAMTDEQLRAYVRDMTHG
jgi:hypothetical protein